MRKIPFTILIVLTAGFLFAQENKSITINTIQADDTELTRNVFHFPRFLDGKVLFKDNVTVDAKLNYHRLFGQILFINPKNDTLALANPEMFKHVIVGSDTFYFHDKGFVRKITHYKTHNLVIKQKIKYIGKEKPGPYGTYSAVSSANSNTTVTTDDQITNYIAINENMIYKYNNEFFLSDEFNNFFRANKKNFYNLFSAHERDIRAYVTNNKTDFNKQADLEKLLQYIKGL